MKSGILSWAEVDLDAIAHNIRSYKHLVGDQVEVYAVIKANAYGHGAIPVAITALENGASRLAVHRLHEGIELRRWGIEAPILIMGYIPDDGVAETALWNLTPTITTSKFAELLSDKILSMGKTMPVHIKVDTGMNRYGLLPGEVKNFVLKITKLKGLFIEGIYTHFATADWLDQSNLQIQLSIFEEVLEDMDKLFIDIPIIHASNSAATMISPRSHFNAVRPGIGIYGLDPSSQWQPAFPLKPAMTLKSRITRIRTIPSGSGVSYGHTYISNKPIKIALVPIGYGDGYPRCLSNNGFVLIHGEKVPIVGRVCMDQCIVDVTAIRDVTLEDEVIVIGKQESGIISAEDVAFLAGTINYEITTSILPRIVRVYLKSGKEFLWQEQFKRTENRASNYQ